MIRRPNINFGNAMRYNIGIADDNRAYLEKFCARLISAGGACLVLSNDVSRSGRRGGGPRQRAVSGNSY